MLMFRYNGKEYVAGNLDKKLRKLGISREDIELYEAPTKEELAEEKRDIKLYYFRNQLTGETITSIKNYITDIPNINLQEWIQI